ncbi:G-coupled receptor -like protein [Brachionus plicatilis]|uniref:G-coupled receptor-like protein n=1 Tax=Brachionus plicatilis TaxID=10195 RepID=A0A3M7T098_BRAPC|nr:G-coupled receptor -like protein [Brachionus plicatilis]
MNFTTIEQNLFNYHEIWGMTIASIYFVIGFPSNLLSIVVCYKSIFHEKFAKMAQNNKFKLMNKEFKTPLIITRPISVHNLTREKNVYEAKYGLNQNSAFSDSYTKLSLKKNCNYLRPVKSSECLTRNPSVITLTERQNYHIMPTIRSSAKNPHCKNFELFLIEISLCDVIIITYNFIEWTLLILSRLKIIDSIYAEPILISKFMCHFIIALNRTVILVHNWLVAFMAITRCYAIYKPLNSTTNFSSKFYFKLNLGVLISLIFIFTTFNIYGVSFLTFTKIPLGNTTMSNSMQKHQSECKISEEVYVKYKYFDAYLNLTLGIIGYSLPCIITLLINLVLIYNIRNLNSCHKGTNIVRRSSDKIGTNSYLVTGKSKIQFFKATSSLLTLSFSYLICNIPYSVLYLLMSLNLVRMNGDVIFAIMCLRYLNHILNFYIYFATGKRFRDDVVKLLKLKK